MSDFTPLDWTICVGYLAIVTAFGIRVSRRQRTTEDYFFGGRRMHWLPIGLSLFAGMFSSLSFVGLPREAAYADWHLYLGILFLPLVVTPIVAWVFLPRYRRLDWSSPYEYLEHRFSRLVRLVASAIFVLYALGWMGTMLVLGGGCRWWFEPDHWRC